MNKMSQKKVMPKRTIFVDSRKRDLAKFPDPGGYVAELDEVAKNVRSVELVAAVYPRSGADLVVSLDIRELNSRILTNCKGVSSSFAQLPMTRAVNEYTAVDLRCAREFRVPLEKLAKLTVQWTDLDGAAYPMADHFLRFEIETSERSAAMDAGFVEGIADVHSARGAAFFGLGDSYCSTSLYNAYVKKRRALSSVSEITRADELYKILLKTCAV